MKTFAKTIVCAVVAGITVSAFAGPHAPAPAPRHCDRGGNDGVRLAANIVGLVGVSLDVLNQIANPQTVIVQRQVVATPPPPPRQVIVTQPVVTQTVLLPPPQPVVVEEVYYRPGPAFPPPPPRTRHGFDRGFQRPMPPPHR